MKEGVRAPWKARVIYTRIFKLYKTRFVLEVIQSESTV